MLSRDFEVLSRRYQELLIASREWKTGFEQVHYLAATGFTLQFPLILAATSPDDNDATFRAKARMISGYLDRLVVHRMVNYRNFGYSQMTYAMFLLIKEVRDLDLDQLRDLLLGKIEDDEESFDAVTAFRLHGRNGSHVKYLLARITSWIDRECSTGQPFPVYMDRSTKNPYEIEHIWANFRARYPEYTNDADFDGARNRFGGLLLLPKDFNASYGPMPYDQKVVHYAGQNLLARSLHPNCYDHNPSFKGLMARHALPCQAYPDAFSSTAMLERQELYRQLCELVCAPAEFGVAEPSTAEEVP